MKNYAGVATLIHRKMNKYEIAQKIEEFAPIETQEDWDCSGWGVNVEGYDEIKKVILCLTVTDNVIKQAISSGCDMIISHHPLFYVPLDWAGINIYSAHTNLDKAKGGTTDTLINILCKNGLQLAKDFGMSGCCEGCEVVNNFIRVINLNSPVLINDFSAIIKKISPSARIVNNFDKKELHRIAFCAGSGSEFITLATSVGADCLVTGDLKFHTALDSPIVLYDIGHFESEIPVLGVFERLIEKSVDIIYAQEKSPFVQI